MSKPRTPKFVCSRCGIGIRPDAPGMSHTPGKWRHNLNGKNGPGCGKDPLPMKYEDYLASKEKS